MNHTFNKISSKENAPCDTFDGGVCIFPFMTNYYGDPQLAEGCTTVDGDQNPWCSIRLDERGYHMQGQYSYCRDNCPVDLREKKMYFFGNLERIS